MASPAHSTNSTMGLFQSCCGRCCSQRYQVSDRWRWCLWFRSLVRYYSDYYCCRIPISWIQSRSKVRSVSLLYCLPVLPVSVFWLYLLIYPPTYPVPATQYFTKPVCLPASQPVCAFSNLSIDPNVHMYREWHLLPWDRRTNLIACNNENWFIIISRSVINWIPPLA